MTAVLDDYEERVGRYFRLRCTEVPAGEGKTRKSDPHRVREMEGRRLMDRLPPGGEVVALTREGKGWGSRELARYLEEQSIRSAPAVTFIIGGAFGLAPSVLNRSTRRLSLSRMTLPHELARLVLVEQLYRAGTILRNEPYHKGP